MDDLFDVFRFITDGDTEGTCQSLSRRRPNIGSDSDNCFVDIFGVQQSAVNILTLYR